MEKKRYKLPEFTQEEIDNLNIIFMKNKTKLNP